MSTKQIETAYIKAGSADLGEFPVYGAVIGKPAIATSALMGKGYFTYDPGYFSTVMCTSSITMVQGDEGVLLYRGYSIEDLASYYTYPAVCQLLMTEKLPGDAAAVDFSEDLQARTAIPQELTNLIAALPQDAHPMAMLMSAVASLEGFYPELCDISNPETRLEAAKTLLAVLPMIASLCHARRHGEQVAPTMRPATTHAEDFLRGIREGDEAPSATLVHAMDQILTLHADHEQNASTAVLRATGSTGANIFACAAAAIGALWGPAHGGANEACLSMLRTIGSTEKVRHFVKRAKDHDDPFRLMGFGHRVYKSYDPRAKIMRGICHDVLKEMDKQNDPMLKVALQLEKIALDDPYFVERKLYPNVDFYSGITLNAMGIHDSFFTVIFAVARSVGWASHWLEMHATEQTRICRPRQLYIGENKRPAPKPSA